MFKYISIHVILVISRFPSTISIFAHPVTLPRGCEPEPLPEAGHVLLELFLLTLDDGPINRRLSRHNPQRLEVQQPWNQIDTAVHGEEVVVVRVDDEEVVGLVEIGRVLQESDQAFAGREVADEWLAHLVDVWNERPWPVICDVLHLDIAIVAVVGVDLLTADGAKLRANGPVV